MSQHIQDHLSRADAVMAALIRTVGPYQVEPDDECHPFQALAQAIAHQQLNGTAAKTILGRLIGGCGKGTFPSPQAVLAAPTAQLRAAGFSFAKVAALKDLAAKSLSAVVPEGAVLMQLTDEEIIARLTQVRGIGRWTVEMLLMFRLARPDVLPVDDFGVRAGFRAAYGLARMPHPKALAAFGERWRPYRSAAAWYLWRAHELKRDGKLPAPAEKIRLPRVKKRRRKAPAKRARPAAKKKRAGKSAANPTRRTGTRAPARARKRSQR